MLLLAELIKNTLLVFFFLFFQGHLGLEWRQAWLGSQPAAEHLPADGQQVGHEALRVEEGSHTGEGQTKGGWTLDHSPLLKF